MRRFGLILAAAPAGLATGLAAWLLAGGASAGLDELEPLRAELSSLKPSHRTGRASAAYPPIADLMASPLFPLTTGPGAVREPALRLDGVSLSRGRAAALLVIDEGPAEWLTIGEQRAGVTVLDITSSNVILDTLIGQKELSLGQRLAGSGPSTLDSSAPGSPSPMAVDQIPPGFPSPPPPASAD